MVGAIWEFANSNFFIALVTAFAGAAAGAFGAQWIITRGERNRRLLQDIQATNSAIMVAFEIVNTFCALKNQHVRGLKETFDKQEKEFRGRFERKRRGALAPGEVFEFQADLQTLTFPRTPTEVLQHLMFERVSVGGRPLSALTRLFVSLDSLADSLRQRNELIAHTKANPPDQNALIALYFGVPSGTGRTDLTYPACVSAISLYTDDAIFFSKILIEDLAQHGRNVAIAFGKGAPKVYQPEFSNAKQQNLIPPDGQYESWLNATKGLAPSVLRKRSWFQLLRRRPRQRMRHEVVGE